MWLTPVILTGYSLFHHSLIVLLGLFPADVEEVGGPQLRSDQFPLRERRPCLRTVDEHRAHATRQTANGKNSYLSRPDGDPLFDHELVIRGLNGRIVPNFAHERCGEKKQS